jgi:molecular chaperone DnaJ
MAPKDYYFILGVARTETPSGIRKAFHDLAKRYHPDRIGAQGTAAFQEILEAYHVLSEPTRRREYNNQLQRVETGEERPAAPVPPYDVAPEPLIPQPFASPPGRRPEPLIPEPMSLLYDFATISPFFGALQDRLRRNFSGIGIPKGERYEALTAEVVLSPEEARYGGMIRLGIPVFVPCPDCAGAGRAWGMFCWGCHGQGVSEREEIVTVRIPPGVPQGSVLECSLAPLGIHNVYLRLHMRISAWG